VVGTPHPFHADVAIACLNAGRHVLVEKPIAVEVGDADRMVATAAHHRLLAVAFQHRSRREVKAARQLVRSARFISPPPRSTRRNVSRSPAAPVRCGRDQAGSSWSLELANAITPSASRGAAVTLPVDRAT
jgi:predicted dehydrogenase